MNPSDPSRAPLPWPDFDRYLAGECATDEAERMRARLANAPAAGVELSTLLQALSPAPGDEPVAADIQAALARLQAARPELLGVVPGGAPAEPAEPVRPSTRPSAPLSASPRGSTSERRTHIRRVALFAAAAGMGFVAYVALRGRTDPMRTTPAGAMREYATEPGQRATITLPDGTRLLLNVDSRLRVPREFGMRTRAVELDGEAQFTVVHDPARPFVVHAHGIAVRDLATTFVVRAYNHGSATTVAVRDGRVAVQLPNVVDSQRLTLGAHDFATISPDGSTHLGRVAQPDEFFGWTTGTLVLRKAPLGSALTQLSRWYGVEFRVADLRLLTHDLTITLPDTLTPVALQDLGDVLGVRVERGVGTITLIPLR